MFLVRIIAVIPIFALLIACTAKPDPVVDVNAQAQECLAEALYFEARGTGPEGRRAVGEVIMNRAAHPEFPSTVCGVVDHRYNGSCQFSYRCDSIPETYNEPVELAHARATALVLLTDRQKDITKGALFFHAASMAPGWFGTLHHLGRFGGNIFYR